MAGTPSNGTAQVETATAVGTVTGSGNATVVVTAAALTGSPKTIAVAVTNGDSAATVAGKIRTALAADADVAAAFTVGGSSTTVVLTAIIKAANDTTLNISIDNGTCTGLTTAATSSNTTAGVRPSYQYVTTPVTLLDTTNGQAYVNAGTAAAPNWTLVGAT